MHEYHVERGILRDIQEDYATQYSVERFLEALIRDSEQKRYSLCVKLYKPNYLIVNSLMKSHSEEATFVMTYEINDVKWQKSEIQHHGTFEISATYHETIMKNLILLHNDLLELTKEFILLHRDQSLKRHNKT